MATNLWSLDIAQPTNQVGAPIVPTAANLTVTALKDFLATLPVGGRATMRTATDQVAATGTLADNGLTGGDVAGAAINGVAATATYATSVNNTLLLIKNKINAGGNTPNDLITKAAYATRYLTNASGTFTFDTNVIAGAAEVVVGTGSTAIAFTTIDSASAADDNINANLCKAAIEADATVGPQVICTVSGGVLTLTGRGANRATLTVSGATVGVPFGAIIAGVPVSVAVGTVTFSGSTDTEVAYVVINGNSISFTCGATDTISAAAAAAAINASTAVNGYVTATNVAGELIICASGKGFHLATSTDAAVGITLTASGTGISADDAIITGSSDEDSVDAIALAIVINKTPALAGIATALVTSSAVVTVFSTVLGDQMPAVGARGTGVTVGGVTTPLTTLTYSGASGSQTVYINGVLVATVAYLTSDTVTAALVVAAINKNPFARTLVRASSAAGVVTIIPVAAVSLNNGSTAAIGGVTASAGYLTASGTYGGIAGNAIVTTTATTGITAGAGTLENGMSGVLVTASQPGICGNWIAFAASGAGAARVTASGTTLGASPSGLIVAGAETVETFQFA